MWYIQIYNICIYVYMCVCVRVYACVYVYICIYITYIGMATLFFCWIGIADRWKQVVTYHLTGRSTAGVTLRQLVDSVIAKAHSIGLHVVTVTSDMGSCIQVMWRSYGIYSTSLSTSAFCPHPAEPGLSWRSPSGEESVHCSTYSQVFYSWWWGD